MFKVMKGSIHKVGWNIVSPFEPTAKNTGLSLFHKVCHFLLMRRNPPRARSPRRTAPPTPTLRVGEWTTLRMQLLWVYERPLSGMQGLLPEHSDFQSVLFVQKGRAQIGAKSGPMLRAHPGQCIVTGQGSRAQRFSNDAVIRSIGFRFQWPTRAPFFQAGLPLVLSESEAPRLWRESDRLFKHMEEGMGVGFHRAQAIVSMDLFLNAQTRFREFLLELTRQLGQRGIEPSRPSDLHRFTHHALQVIDQQTAGTALRARDVAHAVGCSIAHLDRLMVAETGRTVHEQLEGTRLRQAMDALRSGSITLKALAYDLGFSSPPHFHSWFRKQTGTTPLKFRQQEW